MLGGTNTIATISHYETFYECGVVGQLVPRRHSAMHETGKGEPRGDTQKYDTTLRGTAK